MVIVEEVGSSLYLSNFVDDAQRESDTVGQLWHGHEKTGPLCRIPFGDHPIKLERYRED